jgi:hypothetical protein
MYIFHTWPPTRHALAGHAVLALLSPGARIVLAVALAGMRLLLVGLEEFGALRLALELFLRVGLFARVGPQFCASAGGG